jgi:hypothetical protein
VRNALFVPAHTTWALMIALIRLLSHDEQRSEMADANRSTGGSRRVALSR